MEVIGDKVIVPYGGGTVSTIPSRVITVKLANGMIVICLADAGVTMTGTAEEVMSRVQGEIANEMWSALEVR